MEELIARGFCARNYAHEIHLQTRSHATHEALGDFYEDIVPALDRLAECYQGCCGVLHRFPIVRPDQTTPIREWLRNEAKWIEGACGKVCRGRPALENLVQEVLAIYWRALDRLGRE